MACACPRILSRPNTTSWQGSPRSCVRRRFVASLASALVVAAIVASLAYATSAPDRDDVAIGIDIARASSTHNRASDRLVEQIDSYEPFAPADMVNKGLPPSSICFEIWTTNTPGDRRANYEACATAGAKG